VDSFTGPRQLVAVPSTAPDQGSFSRQRGDYLTLTG
jgi:hypothetical protein